MFYTYQQSRFARAFAIASTLCSIRCQCGRVHFTSAKGHGDYEDGELEELQASAANDPDRFIEDSTFDSIDFVSVGNGYTVVHCKCGEADRVATWLDDHADEVAAYVTALFKERVETAKRELTRDEKILSGLSCGVYLK